VRRPADARRAMHAEPDVPFVSDLGLCRVQAHTDPNPGAVRPVVRCQSPLGYNGCSQSRVGAGKREEERIALRVDLATVASFCRLPKDSAVGAKDIAVPLSELLEQPCRALDISEEEGNGPLRELGHSIGVRARSRVVKKMPSDPNGENPRWIARC